MIKWSSLILVLHWTVGCVSPWADSIQVPLKDPRILESHLDLDFEDLAQVENYVIKAFDNEENNCQIPQKKLFAAPQVYRSMRDQKFESLQAVYLKKPLKDKVVFWTSECLKTCSCGVYVAFAEHLQGFNFYLSITELKAVDELEKLQEQERSRTKACMREARWVCESRVLKEIVRRIN